MRKLDTDIETIENSSYDKMNAPNVDLINLELVNLLQELRSFLVQAKRHVEKGAGNMQNKIAGKVEAIADASDVPIGIFDQIKEDEAKIREATKAIEELGDEIKTLEQHETNIYQIMLPAIRNLQEQVERVENMDGQSHAELTVKHWKIQNVLRDVRSMFNQMTRGFSLEEDFKLSLAKIEAGMSALISMYDLIDSYADSQKLGNLIANVMSEDGIKKNNDKDLKNALIYLKKIVHSSIVLDKYNFAIHGIKQHYFPVVDQFFLDRGLPKGLDMEDMDSMTDKAANHVGVLNKAIKEEVSLSTEYDSDMHRETYFDGTRGDKPTFFVWKNETVNKQLRQLFNGEAIKLTADMRNGIDENVVKFRRIGLRFKLLTPYDEQQHEVTQIFEQMYLSMTLT